MNAKLPSIFSCYLNSTWIYYETHDGVSGYFKSTSKFQSTRLCWDYNLLSDGQMRVVSRQVLLFRMELYHPVNNSENTLMWKILPCEASVTEQVDEYCERLWKTVISLSCL